MNLPSLLSRQWPLCLIVTAFLFACTGLLAQPAPAVPQPATSFRLLSTLGSHTDLKYQPTRGQPPIDLLLNQSPSTRYPRPSSGLLQVFRELPPPPDSPPDTPPVRQIVFETRLPADKPSSLIVTQPAGGNPASPFLDVHVLADSLEQHGPGQLGVLNLSRYKIALAIDRDTHEFSAGTTTYIRLPKAAGRMLFRAATLTKANHWSLYYKGEQRLSPIHRGYLIITNYLDDPDYGVTPNPPPVRQRLLFEFVPAASEKP